MLPILNPKSFEVFFFVVYSHSRLTVAFREVPWPVMIAWLLLESESVQLHERNKSGHYPKRDISFSASFHPEVWAAAAEFSKNPDKTPGTLWNQIILI